MPDNLGYFHYFAETFVKGLQPSIFAEAKPLSAIELLYTHAPRFKEFSVIEPSQTEDLLADMQRIPAMTLTKPPFQAQWHKLERICFRSRILHHQNDVRHINDLLIRTASVAKNLPHLVSLEIFNTGVDILGFSDKGMGYPYCLFRYSRQDLGNSLLWESTWQLSEYAHTAEFEFSREVKRAWEQVPHTGHGITAIINEPKNETEEEIFMRQVMCVKGGGHLLANTFTFDAIHPFTRVMMKIAYYENCMRFS